MFLDHKDHMRKDIHRILMIENISLERFFRICDLNLSQTAHVKLPKNSVILHHGIYNIACFRTGTAFPVDTGNWLT